MRAPRGTAAAAGIRVAYRADIAAECLCDFGGEWEERKPDQDGTIHADVHWITSRQGPVQVANIRVMLVDEQRERQAAVAQLLASADCELIAVLTPADDLLTQVLEQQPDVVIIDLDSPGRDTLESLQTVQAQMPRPMVMFSQDDQGESIRRAVHAGVSAYVLDGFDAKRVRPILAAFGAAP